MFSRYVFFTSLSFSFADALKSEDLSPRRIFYTENFALSIFCTSRKNTYHVADEEKKVSHTISAVPLIFYQLLISRTHFNFRRSDLAILTLLSMQCAPRFVIQNILDFTGDGC